jgi:molybdopterin-guanine dinucleotide biosynthesis adapter protein
MKAFTIVGTSKTGKTTTIENIIRELVRRNFSVGSVKEIHFEKFAIDKEGSNTYRHAAAGAEVVTARGHYETDILYSRKLSVEEILKHYDQDYVIMEGVKDYNLPVILCASDSVDIESYRKEDFFNRIFAISGVVSNNEVSFGEIPVINSEKDMGRLADLITEKVFDILPDYPKECCSLCGFSCRELASMILSGKSKRTDCQLNDSKILLAINGEKIGLVPFVQDILSDTIKGFVSNLKGYKKAKKIEIIINQ